jgi:hypothetical protein
VPVESTLSPTDPLWLLITDALRDGPGSPAWDAAVQQLDKLELVKPSGVPIDDYRRLCTAREHLESGKEFRSIRPGPKFTQRLWTAMDAAGERRFWSTRRLLAVVSGALVLAGCVFMIWEMIPRGSTADRDIALLSETLFSKPLASLDASGLDASGGSQSDWTAAGALPLVGDRGLTLPVDDKHSLPAGGGFVLANPIAADMPIAIECRFQVNRATADLVPEVAVSDTNDFANATATSSHELVFAVEGRQVKVIAPDGRIAAQAELPGDGRGELTVRFRIDQQAAIVEMNGQAVFRGPVGLSVRSKRFVAVRILRRGPGGSDSIALHSARVLTAD